MRGKEELRLKAASILERMVLYQSLEPLSTLDHNFITKGCSLPLSRKAPYFSMITALALLTETAWNLLTRLTGPL